MGALMQELAQEPAEIRNPFQKYCKYPDNDRILFKGVHNRFVLYLDTKKEKKLHNRAPPMPELLAPGCRCPDRPQAARCL
jgi:hypothetical protein